MTTPGAATQWLATFHLPPRSLRLHVQSCVHCRNRPAHQEVGTTLITIVITEITHILMVTVGTALTPTVRTGTPGTITPATMTPEES